MKFKLPEAGCQKSQMLAASGLLPSACTRQSSRRGIALVITLIMLAVTLVMAVAFLALARRERGSVTTSTATTTARLAADTAVANAQAQIVANILGSFSGAGSSNAYNFGLLVSTNYINPYGFTPNSGNPTNVNYQYDSSGNALSLAEFEQNVSNLYFLPRVPVFVATNPVVPGNDFRYYLDLNENGRFDTNYFGQDLDGFGNILPGAPYLHTGDPEWVGVLEHPDAPHGPNNHFISRYAFAAIPSGNTLDLNYIHNQALNTSMQAGNDGFMRNQGVGAWEINLAAFLADLNTNVWAGPFPLPNNQYYAYNEPNGINSGYAFQDAFSLLYYRYGLLGYGIQALPTANNVFANAGLVFPNNGIDDYSQGPLQTNLDYFLAAGVIKTTGPWSGANNTNHYFSLGDILDPTKIIPNGFNSFNGRLTSAGTNFDTYDRYTYYRMLAQLGTDSSPEDGKLNLNYSNAVINYTNINGTSVPAGVGIVTGAETNLVPWAPTNFFLAAADQMLRLYTTNWYLSNYPAFTHTFGVTAPFGVSSIPVWVSNRFVYSPSVNRLLQLAANLYDASTNANFNLPHVYRPVFEQVNNANNDIFIVNYVPVTPIINPSNPSADLQLGTPYDVTWLSSAFPFKYNQPLLSNGVPINVYGVPWIIGAKQGLPGFEQLYLTNTVQVARKLLFTRPNVGAPLSQFTTNQMFDMTFYTGVGVSFWNSYTNTYYPHNGGQLTVFANDTIYSGLSAVGSGGTIFSKNNIATFSYGFITNSWPGSIWSGGVPSRQISNSGSNPNSAFLNAFWLMNFPLSPAVYRFASLGGPGFDPIGSTTSSIWETTTPPLPQLPNFAMGTTNYLQAFILDGNNVIDYVQFRDPTTTTNLGPVMADNNYPDHTQVRYQWSTNGYPANTPSISYGLFNQFFVSENPNNAPPSGKWSDPSGFLPSSLWGAVAAQGASAQDAAEAAFFAAFFTPTASGGFTYNGQLYYNTQKQIQAPYTPMRIIFSPFLLQANDPLVHCLASDLNSQTGAKAVWGNGNAWPNGIWKHVDDLASSAFPTVPATPVGGRYQPWGVPLTAPAANANASGYDLSYRDPGVWGSDWWDFPTNAYPAVGWIGRVHRGTPWQTVYLKSSNVLTNTYSVGAKGPQANVGSNSWAVWTGDIQQDFLTGQSIDGARSAPVQDRLLFDIFTTRYNDNSVRGSLPVNQSHLAAWSALLSGLVALSNNAAYTALGAPVAYTSLLINPAGVNTVASPVWQIVNNIDATRANTNLFPYQAFTHAGDVLESAALTEQSPFLNWNSVNQQQAGINDEMYEWLPQQMMGLVRGSEARYVLYCYGQALSPAPGATLSSLLVTNYQVVAESAVRVVLRVDNANTSHPHAVVESYNALPPY
jgi:hypothetical protein